MSRPRPLAASSAESSPMHLQDDGPSRLSPSKRKRRSRKQKDKDQDDSTQDLDSSASSSSSSSSPSHDDNHPPSSTSSVTTLTLSTPPPMPLFTPAKRIPILVASIGNPAPYLDTLHSAGHLVLGFLSQTHKYNAWTPFAGGKRADGNLTGFGILSGYSARGKLPTLWRAGSVMNVSGPAVKKAWEKWRKETTSSQAQNGEEALHPRLIIVHDELERELGSVTVRTDPSASARGHNGLKSIMASMPGERIIRIGIGIGRPASRERDAVSQYVLRKASQKDFAAFEYAAREVGQKIAEVAEGAIG